MEPSKNRRKRDTMSLTTIYNRGYEDSRDSEWNDSDDEYVTDDSQNVRTKRQNERSFFGRRKVLQHEGQVVIKPSHPSLDRSIRCG